MDESLSMPQGSNGPTAAAAPAREPFVPDYDLLRRIGGGAYGEVWLARSKATGVFRAAKIVWRHKFEDERPYQREFEGIQRFERISREHPSQLALFHIGRNDPDGYFYYVMELADPVEGPKPEIRSPKETRSPKSEKPMPEAARPSELGAPSALDPRPSDLYTPRTLRSELARGRLPAGRVLDIGLALSEALEHLHANNLVHRDVKPSNVIFVNGRPKLADIGLVTDASDQCSIVGTEGYLPPEGPGTPQADIFALGKVLYEAATGQNRRDFPLLPADLRSWSDGSLVLELNEILLKAGAPDTQTRYRSAGELHADLAVLRSGQSIRRLRVVERRLALARVAGLVLAGLLAVAGIAYALAVSQARRLEQLLYAADTRLAQTKLEAGDLGEAWRLLDAHMPKAGRKDLRGFEWRYLWRECQGDQLQTWYGHSHDVSCLAFSPDGKSLATGSRDSFIILWDLATGSKLRVPTVRSNEITCVGFSPDGRSLLAGGTDGVVRIWDSASQQVIGGFRTRGIPARLAVAPEGTRVAVGVGHPMFSDQGGTVEVWDYSSEHEECLKVLPEAGARVAYSKDGKLLATGSWQQRIMLWDAMTWDSRDVITNTGDVTALCFSPSGLVLAACNWDGGVALWEVATGRLLRSLAELHTELLALDFSPDGTRLAAGSDDQLIRIWDVASGQEINRLRGARSEIHAVGYTPDGRLLASGGQDRTVMLWDPERKRETLRAVGFVDSGGLWEHRPVFSPDGTTFAAATAKDQVSLFSTSTLRPVAMFTNAVWALGFSPYENQLLTLGCSNLLQRWDLQTTNLVSQVALAPGRAKPWAAAICWKPPRLACGYGKVVAIHNLINGAALVTIHSVNPTGRACALSPDGRILATSGEPGCLDLWETATGHRLTTLTKEKTAFFDAVFSEDGSTLIASGWNGLVTFWDTRTYKEISELTGHRSGAYGLAISPDGRTLASCCGDGTVKLTNLATRREVATLKLANEVDYVAFRPDGNALLTAANGAELRLWLAASANAQTNAWLETKDLATTKTH